MEEWKEKKEEEEGGELGSLKGKEDRKGTCMVRSRLTTKSVINNHKKLACVHLLQMQRRRLQHLDVLQWANILHLPLHSDQRALSSPIRTININVFSLLIRALG